MRDQVEEQKTCVNCKHSGGLTLEGGEGTYYKCTLDSSVDPDLVRGYESCHAFSKRIPLVDETD